jgi:hypothetical protein
MTLVRPYNNRPASLDLATLERYLVTLLTRPTLDSVAMPTTLNGRLVVMYGDSSQCSPAYVCVSGSWEMRHPCIYMAFPSQSVPATLRLSIIAALAHGYGIATRTAYVAAYAARLETVLRELMSGLAMRSDSLVVTQGPTPTQLAFSSDYTRYAAYMDGRWYAPTGEPVEVDDTWITLTC